MLAITTAFTKEKGPLWLGYRGNRRNQANKVRLNVGGIMFETFESTFGRFPETLLGSSEKRTKFYDPVRDEYRLVDRDKHTFDAILFYYQSDGILCRPEHVPSDVFNEELKFYEINDRRFPILQEVLERSDERSSQRELTFRERAWELLENPESSVYARYLSFFTILIIVLSLVTYCLETVPELKQRTLTTEFAGQFDHWLIMECVWIGLFTLELLLRIMFAPNRIRFFLSAFGLIDIVAVVPFYVTLFLRSDSDVTSFSVVRVIRVVRCIRLFKLSRYHSCTAVIVAAVKDCQGKLRTLALCIFITVILFSSSIYYAEGFGEEESQFKSIPDTFYYTIITMVTVGYGDYVPRTVVGRVLGFCCAYSGIIVLYCFPTPIIVMRFVQLYKEHVINEMKRSGKDTREITKKYAGNVFKKKQGKS